VIICAWDLAGQQRRKKFSLGNCTRGGNDVLIVNEKNGQVHL